MSAFLQKLLNAHIILPLAVSEGLLFAVADVAVEGSLGLGLLLDEVTKITLHEPHYLGG